MQKKLTMSDIAKMAGVGKSTVSRYFNGGYVREDTRKRIKKIIDDNNYEPNALAQILKLKQSKIIGIIIPTLDSITSSRMTMTLDEFIRDQGYTPLIINTNHNELRELKSMESLWKLKVDGIVLMASHITMAHHDIASKLDIPIVFVGQKYKQGYCIVYDDFHAGYDVGKFVAEMGHKNIVYMGVDGKDEAVGITRKNGVYSALRDYGVCDIHYLETDFTFDRSRKIIRRYLENHKPSIIICATDNIALACYKEINEKGYRVPDDISLVGFGGYDVSDLLTPSLTTVRFENEEAGCLAGKTIIDLIEKKDSTAIQYVDYILIKGKSVKKLS